jgi:hypothetical protein
LENVPTGEFIKKLLAGGFRAMEIDFVVRFILQNHDFRIRSQELLAEMRKEIVFEKREMNEKRKTLAHVFANCGYVFSITELLAIGNLIDSIDGNSVAHVMARKGHVFSIADIVALGNPINKYGWSIAHIMAEEGNMLDIDELAKIGIFRPFHHKYEPGSQNARLIFENDGPKFITDDIRRIQVADKWEEVKQYRRGFTLQWVFTENIGDPAYFPENVFNCRLTNVNDVYSIQLIEADILCSDNEYFLFQKYSVMEIVEELNRAVLKNIDFELDGYLNHFKKLYWDRGVYLMVSNY